MGIPAAFSKKMVVGENVRDWVFANVGGAIAPYGADYRLVSESELGGAQKHFWRYRRTVSSIGGFGGKSRGESGEAHWSWYRWIPDRFRNPFRLVFGALATHNHFVLDRGGHVFNNKAPVVLLGPGAGEDDYLALLAYLNSSLACFLMKQSCQDRTTHTEDRPEKFAPGTTYFEFTAAGISGVALPPNLCAESFGRVRQGV
jgi:hypothetical protein